MKFNSDSWVVFEGPIGCTGWWFGNPKNFTHEAWGPAMRGRIGEGYKTRVRAERALERAKHADYWSAVWHKAIRNMPVKVKVFYVEEYRPVEPGTLPIPEYIAHQHDRYFIRNGQVHELVTIPAYYHTGAYSTIARLLGYWTTSRSTGQKKPGHNRIYNAKSWGNCPRDPAKRELLLKFAGPDGYELAKKMLTEGWPKIARRYPDRWHGN